MKLKHYGRYILYMCFICSIALLSINFTTIDVNRDVDIIEDKPNRVILKFNEKESVVDGNEPIENWKTPSSTPETNGNSGVQLLPLPDPNWPIILTPL